jgi:AAA+ ATPase superfamily predicted ATPase
MKLNAGGLSSLVIGREEEIVTLKSYISFSQHTVITAPRRYGKTTLANKVLEDLDGEYLVVKFDMFEVSSLEELCDKYLNSIYASVGITNFLYKAKESIFNLLESFKLSYEHEGIKIGYEISNESQIDKKIEKTFHFANTFASLFGKKMVVFIDEFGDIEKFGQDFIKKLRSYMQTHENVTYIFALSQTSVIERIFLDKDNAFFNFASLMNIGLLEENSTIEFLKEFSIDEKALSDEAIDKLSSKTELHPFYLIKTLQEAYIKTLFDKSKVIDTIHINDAIEKILEDNNAYFESLWQKINHKKYKGSIFKAYCIGEGIKELDMNSSYKSQLTKELKSESLLNINNQPTDPFLCHWIKV